MPRFHPPCGRLHLVDVTGNRCDCNGWCLALFAFALCSLWGTSAVGQLPTARLLAAFPAGGQQGTSFDLTITSSTDLDGANRLWFNHPGIGATQKTQMVEGQEQPQPVANAFTVTIAPDVPPGSYEMRAEGTFGVSNPRTFTVGDRPEIAETEPNNSPTETTAVEVGSVVNGRIGAANDIDCFRFKAAAGQRLIITAWAERIDSRLDATLELYNPTGSLVLLNRDWDGRDPLLDYTAPSEGEYVVRLYDFQYAGGNEHFYRLWITDGPYVDCIFPPVAMPGTKQSFTLYGRNLPGGVATDWTTTGGPLEMSTVEIELPAATEMPQLSWASPVRPSEARLDGMAYRLASDKGTANPTRIVWATAPVVLEQEPNSSTDTAQAIEVPCDLAGQFQQPGDVDYYTFTATKGAVYWIELVSQRFGLPTDPILIVERVVVDDKGNSSAKETKEIDDEGTNIGAKHFNSTSRDPVFRLQAPEDGTYRIVVRDLYQTSQGSPRLVYSISIRAETPDFRLSVLPEYPLDGRNAPNTWSPFLRRGGTVRFDCMIFRHDGFAGDVTLTVEGLPPGVTCAGSTIGTGQSATRLILVAAEDAEPWSGEIKIIGTARIGDADVVRHARGATVIWGGTPAVVRSAGQVVLSVGAIAPLGITAQVDRVELVQSSQLNIPLAIARREGFTAKFAVTGDQLPAKVANEGVNVAENQTEATVHLFIEADAPPGTYTLFVQGAASVPSPRKDKEGKPQMVNVVEASTPVTVTIAAGPLTLEPKVPGGGAIKRGAEMKIPVTIKRRNGFEGPVTLGLKLPAAISGVEVPEVTVAADQSAGELIVRATAEATVGNHAHVVIRAGASFNEKDVEVHQRIPLNVQE